MNEITLRKKPINLKEFVKRSAEETDAPLLINQPTVIRDEETKEVILIYGLLPVYASLLGKRLERVKYQTTERTSGLKTVSRIFGSMPRIALRSDFCRMAGLTREDPRTHAMLMEWAKQAERIYEAKAPERHARHTELMKDVLPEYRMPGAIFTSGIINRNNPLKYHFDSGNFDGVFSCMIGFKDGILGGASGSAGIWGASCDR